MYAGVAAHADGATYPKVSAAERALNQLLSRHGCRCRAGKLAWASIQLQTVDGSPWMLWDKPPSYKSQPGPNASETLVPAPS